MELEIKIKSDEISTIFETVNFLDRKSILDWSFISENISSNIDFDFFIETFKNKIDFKSLSINTKLDWSLEFIEKYAGFFDFSLLSNNSNIPFTEDFIAKYSDVLEWGGKHNGNGHKFSWYTLGGLSYNSAFPINKDFIKTNQDKIDFRSLGMNPSICIFDPANYSDFEYYPCYTEVVINSFEIILEFWDKWSFQGSYWHDGNLCTSGINLDSIKDNENIDWDTFELHKQDFKSYYSNY